MKLLLSELAALKPHYLSENLLSIFANITAKPSEDSVSLLEEKGVLVKGVPSQEAKELLDIVSNPDCTCRFVLQDSNLVVEKYSYRRGDTLVLTENANNQLLITQVENLDDTILNLAQFMGMVHIKRAELEIALSKEELLILLAMFDIYREKTMQGYCQIETKLGATFLELRGHLEHPNQTGLVAMIKGNYDWDIPAIENTKALLDNLTAKNVLSYANEYVLTGDYALVGTTFLVTHTIVTAEVLQMNKSGVLTVSSLLYLSAGLKDNLLFIMGDDAIEISAVSSGYALSMLEGFLKCPSMID